MISRPPWRYAYPVELRGVVFGNKQQGQLHLAFSETERIILAIPMRRGWSISVRKLDAIVAWLRHAMLTSQSRLTGNITERSVCRLHDLEGNPLELWQLAGSDAAQVSACLGALNYIS
jgi:hypothetical protein